MTGVSSGTRSSRGVRAVSWKRRRASVATGPSERDRAFGAGIAISALDTILLSGGRRERVAGQSQVDVVESRLAGADRAGEPEPVDRGDRFAGARVVERNGEPRAD